MKLESAPVWNADSQVQDDWGSDSSTAPVTETRVSLTHCIETNS